MTIRKGGAARRDGFTFVELMVTIAIVGIIFSVSLGISQVIVPESGLAATASDLSKAIEQARLEAILAGRLTWFQIQLGERDDSPQLYRSITEPAPGEDRPPPDQETDLVIRDWKRVPKEVRIESVTIGEATPAKHGMIQVPIQSDGTMPSHLIRLWSPEVDPQQRKQIGWACVQVAGLLGQARVLNRYVEPDFLREDVFR